MREIFNRLAQVVASVLPHDVVGIAILDDDRCHATVHALAGLKQLHVPQVVPVPSHIKLADGWTYFVVDDLLAIPGEEDDEPARLGFRSSLRVPIRVGGKLVGGVDFTSFEPRRYRVSDVSVVRRVADHLALALSHERLAAENQRAAELRERASSLEVLEGLLNTLTEVLDIREVFDRVSEIAQGVLPHDLLGVMEIGESGGQIRLLATAGKAGNFRNFELPVQNSEFFANPWDAMVIDNVPTHAFFSRGPAAKAGVQSVVTMPVRFGSRLRAAVNFFCLQKKHFAPEDVLVAKRIASHVAPAMSHHRLAEEARQRHEPEAHASQLELLDQSLASLTGTGEIKEVIDRVSTVARQVLPHVGLALSVLTPDRHHARRYVTSGWDSSAFPEVMEISPDFDPDAEWEFDLVDDLSTRSEPLNRLVTTMGFLSVLRVPIHLDGRFAASLAFLSRSRSTFQTRDVPTARRIADRLALSLEREHRVEAGKRAESADARAAVLESRVRQPTDEMDSRTGCRRVIGESRPWREVLKQAAQVAAVETTVLLFAESGTGKEVVARFLHRGSARREGPFVALNCADLPDNLLEPELFGYERGAFTGAMQPKPGLIEQAAGGLLFLDEVGEMAMAAQAKFLRVLQEREFQRLGGTRVPRADVRVVAATNRDLRKAIEQRLFREDLFFRLNVFELHLLPLRERFDDILPLSEEFLKEIGRSFGRPPAGISHEAKQALTNYHWPRNVRELRNVLERAAILADGGLIVAEHLSL